MVRLLVIVNYTIHREYIATTLCVERDKPEPTCSGKCYLSDQLEKTEDKSSESTPAKIKEFKEIFLYFQDDFLNHSSQFNSLLKNNYPREFFPGDQYLSDIFHPPQLLPSLHPELPFGS